MGQARDTDRTPTQHDPLVRLCETLQQVLAHPAPHGLARSLCELLGVDTVLLAELPLASASTTANVLEGWSHGSPAERFSYALAGSPCDVTLRQGVCVHPRGVALAYPEDVALADGAVEAYAGHVLRDRDGVPRGLLVALSREPLQDSDWIAQVFVAFSALALAELEHRRWRREHDGRAMFIHELVERLSDAVAVLVVDPPLDLQQPVPEQARHLMAHARVTAANATAAGHPSRAGVTLLGAGLAELHGAEAAPLVSAWLAHGRPSTPHRIVHTDAQGDEMHWDCMLIPVVDQDHLVRIWSMKRDMTRHERHVDVIRRQALIDPLTGLGNRAALHERLQDRYARSSHRLAMALLDVHQFRAINEAMGHATGDGVLQIIATRLARWSEPGWTREAFRLAADEFAVLIEAQDVSGGAPPDLRTPLDRLAAALQEPMQVSQTDLSITLAVGCARHGDGCSSPDTLLWRADLAKRHARERGLTLVEYDDTLQPPMRRLDLGLRADLRQAVVQQQFVLRYQPKVRPACGTLVGFEALIRWPHPRSGHEVSPAEFIPYVEATSYIHPVTRWVLDQALNDLAGLHDHPQLSMAVNISAKNLLDDGFVPMVQQALARHGVAPRRLELELTESSFLTSPQTARQQVEALSALGVRVSIDDFGTGYSSLSYLQDLPVHAIKVDQAFVRPMLGTAKSATIVRIAVELAHALGMQAIAEGVETPDLVPLLAAMGYDAIQGFAIARPMPLHDALRTSLAWSATMATTAPAITA